MPKLIKMVVDACCDCPHNNEDECNITGFATRPYRYPFPDWCPLDDFIDPEHNPEPHPDTERKTPPVSEPANP